MPLSRTHPDFDRDVDQAEKKYPNARREIEDFARLLDTNPRQWRGDRIPGMGNQEVYKARAMSPSLGHGKRGGWRIILYYDRDADDYEFVALYSHVGAHRLGKRESDVIATVKQRLGI